MGYGLKRAVAAAALTRWDGVLTQEMRRFLSALPDDGEAIPPRHLALVCTEAQNQARAKCRKLGLAEMGSSDLGKRGWQITDHGVAALKRDRDAGTTP